MPSDPAWLDARMTPRASVIRAARSSGLDVINDWIARRHSSREGGPPLLAASTGWTTSCPRWAAMNL